MPIPLMGCGEPPAAAWTLHSHCNTHNSLSPRHTPHYRGMCVPQVSCTNQVFPQRQDSPGSICLFLILFCLSPSWAAVLLTGVLAEHRRFMGSVVMEGWSWYHQREQSGGLQRGGSCGSLKAPHPLNGGNWNSDRPASCQGEARFGDPGQTLFHRPSF